MIRSTQRLWICISAAFILSACPLIDNEQTGKQASEDAGGAASASGPESDSGAANNNGPESNSGGQITIYDIQDTTRAQHPRVDTDVELKDKVVTAVGPRIEGKGRQFFIGEPEGGPFSGIQLFDTASLVPSEIALGDVVSLRGRYVEYNDCSQIAFKDSAASYFHVTRRGAEVPVASISADDIGSIATDGALAEAYEGVLVQVVGELNVAEMLEYGEFSVRNAANQTLRVDDALYPDAEVGRARGQRISTLRGVMLYSFANFKLAPRDEHDLVTEKSPVVAPGNPAATVTPVAVTTYRIQDRSRTDAVAVNDTVRLEGLVVTATREARGSFYAQTPTASPSYAGEDFSGIYIYRTPAATNVPVAVGDVVTVEGAYVEFKGLSEVKAGKDVSSVQVTAQGAQVPIAALGADDIATIATGGARAEALESVLISIEGELTVAALHEEGEFSVRNAAGDVLRVDEKLLKGVGQRLEVGRTITTLRGPLTFSFQEFKVEPRDESDLVVVPGFPERDRP